MTARSTGRQGAMWKPPAGQYGPAGVSTTRSATAFTGLCCHAPTAFTVTMTLVPEALPPEPDDDLRTLLLGFRGRVARKPFWLYGVVGVSLAQLIAYALLGIAGVGERAADAISTLLVVWPGLAISVKRWHDRGKSGWWVLINLIPLV